MHKIAAERDAAKVNEARWKKEREEVADAVERAIFVVGAGNTTEEALADAHDKRRMALDPLLIRLRPPEPECSICRRRHGIEIKHPCE